MRLKAGVRVSGIRPETLLALLIADSLYTAAGVELVVTSVVDGRHKAGSRHFAAFAADLRTKNLPSSTPAGVMRNLLGEALGEDFDVVLEDAGGENEHLHVEYDPKRPLTIQSV